MKSQMRFVYLLFLVTGVLTSCQIEDPTNDSGDYWSSNYLTKNGLHGPVHTWFSSFQGYYGYAEFNRDGNPVSGYSAWAGYGVSDTSTWSMEYANGKRIKYTYVPNSKRPSIKDITNYAYANVGKFIPEATSLFSGNLDLIPDLSAVYTENSSVDYTFYGSELWVVRTEDDLPNDTTIVQYTGNYPSSFSNRLYECNRILYAKNGMILSYSVLCKEISTQVVYTYVIDDKYLMLDNVVTTDLRFESQSYRLYKYNSHKDLLEALSDDDWSERYSNYTYDAKGNWTSRSCSYRPYGKESDWEPYGTIMQQYTYY
jgi:hypothetical protein